jgi:hypothetical protein
VRLVTFRFANGSFMPMVMDSATNSVIGSRRSHDRSVHLDKKW